ncbi:hypothetical protein FN846DRAFT_904305 [Sphaerosporella brunnea]|uniref:NADH:flavin oxidoreductase/NADH oxidase N-terminal domain-containing protein n=1 Tax=Sphaerosporella brunnea TaxID=1250544 RepID=A0A5J5F548_9PEZI|nr:hypothetical protein FN846DRAFT_904305 [Sphaerosporella brunnea]
MSSGLADTKLFSPLEIGRYTLKHRNESLLRASFGSSLLTGRITHPLNIGGSTPLGPSKNKVQEGMVFLTPDGPQPHIEAEEMAEEDIKEAIEDFAHAFKCAFDGVEIRSAHGFLPNQSLCDEINFRKEKYGGSIEHRTRFMLEVVGAVDIVGDYGYAIGEFDKRGLAYIHLVELSSDLFGTDEAKVKQPKEIAKERDIEEEDVLTLKPFRAIIKATPLIAAGSYTNTNAAPAVESGATDAVAFGRYFISNPDPPERLAKGYPLAEYSRNTFYTGGLEGFTDYPTCQEAKA